MVEVHRMSKHWIRVLTINMIEVLDKIATTLFLKNQIPIQHIMGKVLPNKEDGLCLICMPLPLQIQLKRLLKTA